ncbi:MAG: TonB-dependent receptor [Bdellovibrionaceae bacterium]|nr:TonB-dependent receptor [Pseudobdellovibrionaceae bacterium]
MKVYTKLIIKLAVWVGLVAYSYICFANVQTELKGQVLIFVFRDGMPASDVKVQTPIGLVKTTSEGFISVALSAQKNQKFTILENKQKFNVNVLNNKETQVVVHLGNNFSVEIKEPHVFVKKRYADKSLNTQILRLKIQSTTGQPIAKAKVLLSEKEEMLQTDQKGQLEIVLSEGFYNVSIFHDDYQALNLYDVELANHTKSLNLELKSTKNLLEDMIVLAPKMKENFSSLVEVRKKSSAVTDVLGAEQMRRAGDSDAASSLRRVTGLTLVGGKYVYVRGLGERYSGVQMNAFSLPSPEPSRRVVPLDLFPTAIMESIIVQKSYTPDLPAEFGGGIIQLQTKSTPEKFYFRASVSAANENLGVGPSYQGGSLDWLGMDDGTRKMPSILQNAVNQGRALEINTVGFDGGVSEEELVQMSQSMSNNYELKQQQAQSLPGISISTGNGWRVESESFGKLKLGTSLSALYGQSTDQVERTSKSLVVGQGNHLVEDHRKISDYTEIETRLAGSLGLHAETKNHKFEISSFMLRNTTHLAQDSRTDFVSGNPTDSIVMDFVERELWTRHLKGEHHIANVWNESLTLDWRWGFADATRDSKDRREVAYDVSGVDRILLNDSARRSFATLLDRSEERAINFTLPINFSNKKDFAKIKFGALSLDRRRDSDMNRFMFINKGSVTGYNSAELAYSPENMGTNGFLLNNISANSTQADNYLGEQTINAQYAMIDLSPFDKWSFQLGMRHEVSKQKVRTFNYTNPKVDSSNSIITMRDFLPAYGVVWKPTEKIRTRLTYSETLARPDFREMSPVGFTDDETGYIVSGNPNLKGTVIKNVDHRWEYYFTADEYASVGVFYKHFENPIEAVFLSGPNRIQSFQNALAANNYGIEFEGRIGGRHLLRSLRRLTLLTNVSFIESEIEMSQGNISTQSSDSRPLQGQSPFVFNMQLQYDRPLWGFSATLLYNIIGKRITEVGVNGIPDTYEQSAGQLDFVASKKILDNWTLSIRARNLLDPNVVATQNDEIVRSLKRGRDFALTVGGVF